jgi:hypothetical protein
VQRLPRVWPQQKELPDNEGGMSVDINRPKGFHRAPVLEYCCPFCCRMSPTAEWKREQCPQCGRPYHFGDICITDPAGLIRAGDLVSGILVPNGTIVLSVEGPIVVLSAPIQGDCKLTFSVASTEGAQA